MEIIISFCPLYTFSTPGIIAQRPPATAPAIRHIIMAGSPVKPHWVAITVHTTEPIINWPSPPKLNTPHL